METFFGDLNPSEITEIKLPVIALAPFMDGPFGDIVVALDCKTRHMRFIYGYVSSQLYRLGKLLKTDLTDYYYPALLVSEGKFGHFHTQKISPLLRLEVRD